MMKYITKLKKTLICDVELYYNRKIFLKPRQINKSKKVQLNFVYLNNCDQLLRSFINV